MISKKNVYIKYSLLFLIFMYVFSLCSFSGKTGLHYIYYAVILLILINVIVHYAYERKLAFSRSMLIYPLLSFYMMIVTLFTTRDFSSCLTMLILSFTLLILIEAFYIIENKFNVLLAIWLGLVAFAFYFLIIYFDKIIRFDFSSRLGDYFGNQNSVGIYLLFGFLISLDLAIIKKKYWAFIFSILFIILSLTTGSKKVFLSFLVSVFYYSWFLFKNKKNYLIAATIIFVIAIIILFMPFMDSLRERFVDSLISFLYGGGDASTDVRIDFINQAFMLGTKSFLIGNGSDAFAILTGNGTYSHSNLAELFCNFGLIGLVLFYFPIIMMIYLHYKNSSSNREICIFISIFYLINCMTFVYFADKFFYILVSFSIFSNNELINKNNIFSLKEIFKNVLREFKVKIISNSREIDV